MTPSLAPVRMEKRFPPALPRQRGGQHTSTAGAFGRSGLSKAESLSQRRNPAVTGALHSFAMTLSLQALGVQNSAVWRMSSLHTNAGFFFCFPLMAQAWLEEKVWANDASVQSSSCLLGGRTAEGKRPAEETAA